MSILLIEMLVLEQNPVADMINVAESFIKKNLILFSCILAIHKFHESTLIHQIGFLNAFNRTLRIRHAETIYHCYMISVCHLTPYDLPVFLSDQTLHQIHARILSKDGSRIQSHRQRALYHKISFLSEKFFSCAEQTAL